MKVVVVGGAGFIGGHLIKALQKNDDTVLVVDIKEPKDDVKFKKIDALSTNALREIFNGYDAVIDLASLVGVNACFENPEKVYQNNLETTKSIYTACRKSGIGKLIYASSSEVYGDGERVPFVEDDQKLPKSAYGKAKLQSEEFLKKQVLKDSNVVKVCVVRPFNVYGPKQRNEFVVPIFVKQALNNEVIKINGDGEQIRCFTFVSDVVDGIVNCLNSNTGDFNVFNLGNPEAETSMNHLAELIVDKTKSNSKIIHIPLDQKNSRSSTIEIFRRIPSIDRASTTVSFKPRISLEQGVDLEIDEIKAERLVE